MRPEPTSNSIDEGTGLGCGSTAFLVDADPAARDDLFQLLTECGLQVRVFSDPSAFLANVDPGDSGCIVFDSDLGEKAGLNIHVELQQRGVEMPLILLTQKHDVHRGVSAMKAGAVDFLLKPLNRTEMVNAVQYALNRDQLRRDALEARREVLERVQSLTPRESQLFGAVTRGLMNKQIAYQLGISEIMVKIHRGKMVRKMNARSVADLVRMHELIKSEGAASAFTLH